MNSPGSGGIAPAGRVVERCIAQRDLRDPGAAGIEVEEAVQERPAQVELDERHPLAGTRKRDSQVRDRRRLALLLDGARHHDRAGIARERRELQVRPQHAEHLRLHAERLLEHRQAVGLAQLPGRLRQLRE
jgi:hypothetical protein